MKKYSAMLLALALILGVFAGCGAAPAPETTEPVAAVQETQPPTQAPTETQPQETQAPAPDPQVLYAAVLDRYATALKEQWNEGQYFENEMCELAAYYYEGSALENVGFVFADMDHDGSPELIIGAILGAQEDPAVFEIWTLEEGTPVRLALSGARNRYFVEYSPEADFWGILNHGSNGAANFAFHCYYLEDGAMKISQALVFDAMADEENPWFIAYDSDWDTSNDTPVDEATATGLMDSYSARYSALDYTPFSRYGA